MKRVAPAICLVIGLALVFVVGRSANHTLAPLFLDSRIERLGENNLPKITVRGDTVYCRMKADDFSFPFPQGASAENPVVTGGFDIVEGSVEARFEGTNFVTANQYEKFLIGKVAMGGTVTAWNVPGGLLIKFRYFGDR